MDELAPAWTEVCQASDVPAGKAFRVALDPPLAIFNVGGEYFAIDDTCTHAEASLADGYIDGDVVECAFHLARFSLRTGQVLSLPATVPVCTYPVKVEGGRVYVQHSSAERA